MKDRSVLFFIFLVLFQFQAFGASQENCDNILGSSHFLSRDEDSLSFVKDILLYNSFRDVITKKMVCLGLDAEMFWTQFDKAFSAHFSSIEKNLEENYQLTVKDKDQTAQKKERVEYEKGLRVKLLIAKRKFGNIDKVITSYSVRKMTRAVNYPNSRYMQLSAVIDENSLRTLYYDYTQVNENRRIDRVLISISFDIQKMQWTDVGVDTDKRFKVAILDSWQKWLQDNWGSFVKDIEQVSDAQLIELNKTFLLPDDSKDRMVITASTEQYISAKPQSGNNSVWLKFDFTLAKDYENVLSGRRDIVLSGQLIVFDLLTGKIISSYDFPAEKKQFSGDEDSSVTSAIATSIYRVPLEVLKSMTKRISTMTVNEKVAIVQLKNLSSIKDVFTFIGHLETWGGKYQLQAEMDNYRGTTAAIKMYFNTTKEKILELLQSLTGVEFDSERSVVVEANDQAYELSLMQKGKPLSKE